MEIFEILKYILPSVVVFFTAYYLLRLHTNTDLEKAKYELYLKNQKILIPIRLQAYERMILFLERISPEALISRLSNSQMTVSQLHSLLLQTIRSEYSHNLSQQLYLSSQAWTAIAGAKENVIKAINLTAANLAPEATALDLSKKLIENFSKIKKSPVRVAIDILKEEAARFLEK